MTVLFSAFEGAIVSLRLVVELGKLDGNVLLNILQTHFIGGSVQFQNTPAFVFGLHDPGMRADVPPDLADLLFSLLAVARRHYRWLDFP